MAFRLYGYWRSSATYRVRIALNLKGVAWEYVPVHIFNNEHHSEAYAAMNPMRVVPTLEHDGEHFVESAAILEYLDELHPAPPLLPTAPAARQRVRAMADLVVAGTQPLQNMSVLRYVGAELGQDKSGVDDWARHWISRGLTALETMATRHTSARQFCFGDTLSLADICLAPQMYNARRFGLDLAAWPTLTAVDAHINTLPAFVDAAPERQVDAP